MKSERKVNKRTLLDIISNYRVFFNPKTRYCRAVVIFLLCTQGFNPFTSGYEYELIHRGFTKNSINTIGNIVLIPITVFAIYISPRISSIGWLKCVVAVFIAKWIYCAIAVATFETEAAITVPFVFVSLLLSHLMDTSYFILNSVLINSFPVMGLSGMFITMMASCWNFGQLKSPHLALIGIWGWKTCTIVGLVLQVFLIAAYPWAYNNMMAADLGIDPELMEEKDDNSEDDNLNEAIAQSNSQPKKELKEEIEMVDIGPK